MFLKSIDNFHSVLFLLHWGNPTFACGSFYRTATVVPLSDSARPDRDGVTD